MTTTYVYALADPDTSEEKYIGISNNPHLRYRQHLTMRAQAEKLRWIGELAQRGKLPEMKILEGVDSSAAKECEARWIKEMRARGRVLVNINNVAEQSSRNELDKILGTIRQLHHKVAPPKPKSQKFGVYQSEREIITVSISRELAAAARLKSKQTRVPYSRVIQQAIIYWVSGGDLPPTSSGDLSALPSAPSEKERDGVEG